MPLPIRTPEETDALKARAREMRAGGASVTDTAQALGLPASTLYRWAAEGGWRGRDLARERYRAALRDAACGGSSGQAIAGSNTSSVPAQIPAQIPALCRDLPEQAVNPEASVGPGINPGQMCDEDHEDTPAPAMTPEEARASGEKALRAARALMEAGDLRGADLAMRLSERMLDAAKALAALPKPEGEDEKRGTSGLSLDEARLIIGYRLTRIRAQRLNAEHYPAHPEDMPEPPRPGEIITCEHLGASGLPMADGGTYPVVPRAALLWPWRPEKWAEGEKE